MLANFVIIWSLLVSSIPVLATPVLNQARSIECSAFPQHASLGVRTVETENGTELRGAYLSVNFQSASNFPCSLSGDNVVCRGQWNGGSLGSFKITISQQQNGLYSAAITADRDSDTSGGMVLGCLPSFNSLR